MRSEKTAISLSFDSETKHDEATYGTVTGKSGPSNLEPSQKQSSGVMMAHGKILSKI